MKTLPENVKPYKKTAIFTHETVPNALLNDHNTKAGVWGVLHVEEGVLKYVITEPGQEEEIQLSPPQVAIIAPEQKHHVSFVTGGAFYVEFHK